MSMGIIALQGGEDVNYWEPADILVELVDAGFYSVRITEDRAGSTEWLQVIATAY